MANYILSKKAIHDLSEIWDYTYETWSEKQADKYYDLLLEACMKISIKPTIGKKYEKIEKSILGYLIGQHLVFYRVNPFTEIEIIRILHQKTDYKNRLEGK